MDVKWRFQELIDWGRSVHRDRSDVSVFWNEDFLMMKFLMGVDRSRSVEWPRGIGSGDNPDEGSVGMCVWAVSADSGNEAKESDKGLNFLKFYFIFCFDKSFSFYNACDKVPSDKFTKSI